MFVANPSRARCAAAITSSPSGRRPAWSGGRRIGFSLVLPALLVLGALPARGLVPAVGAGRPVPRAAAMATRHDVHLTYSRVVVDGASVLWRVRLFRDDLEKSLAEATRNPAFRVTSPGADSVFGAYFNAQVPVTANGKRLTGRVLQSGRDADVTDQDMWWYLIELPAPAPVTSLSTRVGLLFEHFTDQRNIMTLLKMPGEERHSLYFVREDAKLQTIVF